MQQKCKSCNGVACGKKGETSATAFRAVLEATTACTACGAVVQAPSVESNDGRDDGVREKAGVTKTHRHDGAGDVPTSRVVVSDVAAPPRVSSDDSVIGRGDRCNNEVGEAEEQEQKGHEHCTRDQTASRTQPTTTGARTWTTAITVLAALWNSNVLLHDHSCMGRGALWDDKNRLLSWVHRLLRVWVDRLLWYRLSCLHPIQLLLSLVLTEGFKLLRIHLHRHTFRIVRHLDRFYCTYSSTYLCAECILRTDLNECDGQRLSKIVSFVFCFVCSNFQLCCWVSRQSLSPV